MATSIGIESDPVPAGPREFRGVWVATVDNIDWPSKRTLSTSEQKAELVAILNSAAKAGLNAVVFQIRPSCDALYPSKLEPWSEYLTGAQGKAPEPLWDPLAYAIHEAHERGMELHAWFNPYRAKHPAAKGDLAESHMANRKPALVKSYGSYMWLDPGDPDVQKHSLAVMLDVVRRYDVDGIHIDDYFYPYKSYANGADFPDDESWGRYRASGGKLSRADWRRKNVDDFVRRIYTETKKLKPWVKFGISPFGIYRPGHPADVKTTFDQYEQLYADARKWLVEGWCDYYAPQLYWKIKGDQPFPSLLSWWSKNNPKRRHLWPGLFTGRISQTQGDWPVQEIVDQVELVQNSGSSATGTIHFSMKSIFGNWKGLSDALAKGPYKGPALVPGSPWLESTPPKAPRVGPSQIEEFTQSTIFECDAKDAKWWAVYSRRAGSWELSAVEPYLGKPFAHIWAKADGVEAIAVSVVDRYGNESPRTVAPGGG